MTEQAGRTMADIHRVVREIGDLPDFPSESLSHLVVQTYSEGGVPSGWHTSRRATVRDVLDNLRELSLPDREEIARAICPELAVRLRRAEEVVDGALDCRLATHRAENYVQRYGFGGFAVGENPTTPEPESS